MEVLEAFADVIEAFMEVASTNVFMEAFVEASMKDEEDMKASSPVPSAMEALTEVSFTEASTEASVEASMECMKDMRSSTQVTFPGSPTKAPTEAAMEVSSTKSSIEAFMGVKEAFSDVLEYFM